MSALSLAKVPSSILTLDKVPVQRSVTLKNVPVIHNTDWMEDLNASMMYGEKF